MSLLIQLVIINLSIKGTANYHCITKLMKTKYLLFAPAHIKGRNILEYKACYIVHAYL